MRTAFAILALLALAPPARAHRRDQVIHVRTMVVPGARIHAGPSRLELAGRAAVSVAIDAAPARLVTGDVTLPPGTRIVTIHY